MGLAVAIGNVRADAATAAGTDAEVGSVSTVVAATVWVDVVNTGMLDLADGVAAAEIDIEVLGGSKIGVAAHFCVSNADVGMSSAAVGMAGSDIEAVSVIAGLATRIWVADTDDVGLDLGVDLAGADVEVGSASAVVATTVWADEGDEVGLDFGVKGASQAVAVGESKLLCLSSVTRAVESWFKSTRPPVSVIGCDAPSRLLALPIWTVFGTACVGPPASPEMSGTTETSSGGEMSEMKFRHRSASSNS